MKRAFALIGIAALSACQAGCRPPAAASKGSEETARPKATVVKPERKTLRRSTTPQPANIEAYEQTPLFARIDGLVRKTRTVIGDDGKPVEKELPDIDDRVESGEVLAELAVPEREAEVRQKQALIQQATAMTEQARAGIMRAEGEYSRWKAEHTRISQLAAKGSVSEKLVDETQNQFRAATAAKEAAAADLTAALAKLGVARAEEQLARSWLEYAKIRAPFKGVVTERHVDTGGYARPPQGAMAKPLFAVCRTDWVRIFVEVPEYDAPLLDAGEHGDQAIVHVDALGEKPITGKVTRTSWVHDAIKRSLRAEVDLPNAQGHLRPGMYATVVIVLEERTGALVLPVSAVIREGGKTFCHCVASERVVRKPISLGLRADDEVEVSTGLNGDELVIRDNPAAFPPDQEVEASVPKAP